MLCLSDLVLGYMDALKLPIHNRYLQVGHGDEFVMDINKVPHLLGKTAYIMFIHICIFKIRKLVK